MKIGLIDVDSKIPNLALMKIAAWHKAQGDFVKWFDPLFDNPDRVYGSKIFNFTPDYDGGFPDCEVIRGGTGYDIKSKLADNIEMMPPDYSLYPCCDYSLGFITRGCINSCSWCVVPEKEGKLRKNSTWWNIWRGAGFRKIIFMDNNALASSWAISQLEDLIKCNEYFGRGNKILIDFNQGMDARLIDGAIVSGLLSKLNWIRFIRMACDCQMMVEPVKQAIMAIRTYMPRREIFIYLLVRDVEEAEARMHEFDGISGLTFFAQPYRNPWTVEQPTEEQLSFARFVNVKGGHLRHKMAFKDYKRT